MPLDQDKAEYLAEMVRRRGYVSRVHIALAAHDLAVLKAYDPIPTSVYIDDRTLGRAVMELCLVAGMTCLRGAPYALQSHMRKAVHLGTAPGAVLEALELILPEAGRIVVQRAIDAWAELYPHDPSIPDPQETMTMKDAVPTGSAEDLGARIEGLRHPRVYQAVTGLLDEVYVRDRRLDRVMKEYLLVTALTCLRADRQRLAEHMRRALAAGATAEDLLEVLELTIPHGGLLTFEHGLAAWSEVTGAEEATPEGAMFTRLG